MIQEEIMYGGLFRKKEKSNVRFELYDNQKMKLTILFASFLCLSRKWGLCN